MESQQNPNNVLRVSSCSSDSFSYSELHEQSQPNFVIPKPDPLNPVHHINTQMDNFPNNNYEQQKNNQHDQTNLNESIDGYYNKPNPIPLHQYQILNDSVISYSIYSQRSEEQDQEAIRSILSDVSLNSDKDSPSLQKALHHLQKCQPNHQNHLKNYQQNDDNTKKAKQSQASLKSSNFFNQDQSTQLFFLDHMALKPIQQAYLNKLKSTNMYLMNKILIGPKTKYQKIKMLLKVPFESLQNLYLERAWNSKEDQHPFDFIENPENLQIITHLTLKANYFTEKWLTAEDKFYQFESLKILELDFDDEISNDHLYNFLQRIAKYNSNFQLKLWTGRTLEEFTGNIEEYTSLFDLRPKSERMKEEPQPVKGKFEENKDLVNKSLSSNKRNEEANFNKGIQYEGIKTENENVTFRSKAVMGPNIELENRIEEGSGIKGSDAIKMLESQSQFSKGVSYKNVETISKNTVYEGEFVFGPSISVKNHFGVKN